MVFVALVTSIPPDLMFLSSGLAGVEDEKNLKVPKPWEAKVDYASASSSATWVDRIALDAIPFQMPTGFLLKGVFFGVKVPNLVNVLVCGFEILTREFCCSIFWCK